MELQEHDIAAQEAERAKVKAEMEAAAEATRQLATAAADILACPWPAHTQPAPKKRKPWKPHNAEPPPASRWPGGVTDALEDEDIAAAFSGRAGLALCQVSSASICLDARIGMGQNEPQHSSSTCLS